jgi:hypothetical protein
MIYLSLFPTSKYLYIHIEEIHSKSMPIIYINQKFIQMKKILNDLKRTQN